MGTSTVEENTASTPTQIQISISNSGEEKDIDTILSQESKFSRFNIFVHLVSFYLSLTVNGNNVIAIFTGQETSWKCKTNSNNSFCIENANKTFDLNHIDFYKRCQLTRQDWNYVEPKELSFVVEFDLACEGKIWKVLIDSSFYIGGIFGLFLAGKAADSFGRKKVVIISLVVCFTSSFLGYFVASSLQLFLVNMVVGSGTFSCFFTMFSFLFEIAHPSHRTVSTLFMAFGFVLAFLLIDLEAFCIKNWRNLKLFSTIPCTILLPLLLMIPESPRWLLSQGRCKEATQSIEKIISYNKSKNSFVIKVEEQTSSSIYGYKALFSNLKTSILTLSVASTRFVNFFVYYALIFGSPYLGGDNYASFALSLIPNIFANFVASIVGKKVGRRKAWLGNIGITGILILALACIPITLSFRFYINIVLSMLSVFFCVLALDTIYTWTFEVFPTPVRLEGTSVCVMIDRIGIAATPFLLQFCFSIHHSLPYAITDVVILIGMVMTYKVMPETSTKPLREDMFEFVGRNGVPIKENIITSIGNPAFHQEESNTQQT